MGPVFSPGSRRHPPSVPTSSAPTTRRRGSARGMCASARALRPRRGTRRRGDAPGPGSWSPICAMGGGTEAGSGPGLPGWGAPSPREPRRSLGRGPFPVKASTCPQQARHCLAAALGGPDQTTSFSAKGVTIWATREARDLRISRVSPTEGGGGRTIEFLNFDWSYLAEEHKEMQSFFSSRM